MSRLVRFSNNPACQQMEAISLFVRLSVIFFERYILFSYVDSRKGTVIYIEGKLSPDDILKLCYSKY